LTLTTTLTDRASEFLDRRTNRRGFLSRTALVGSALTVAGPTYVLRPRTAYAAVCSCPTTSGAFRRSCNCTDLCCDGYTEFCCQIYGANSCPANTVLAGWWKVDNSHFCNGSARYYLDCNKVSPNCSCGSSGVCRGSDTTCQCRSCGYRKDGCTAFRYGNCNNHISCVGPIMCRVVTCTKPWEIDPGCSTVSRTDNNTRYHDRPCAAPEPTFAHLAFIEGLYWDFLGRPSDQAGRDYWGAILAQGNHLPGGNRDVVSYAFAFSEEYVTTVVDALYRLAFDRDPDAEGRKFWTDKVLAGLRPSAVAAEFFGSAEFWTESGKDPGRFVDRLFRRILDRAPDAAAREYWISQMSAGRTRTSVAKEIYQSLESRRRRVKTVYRRFLDRDPDRAGLDYWSDVIASREDVAVALYLTASQEYFQRCSERFS
jgi:hypothetical protein